MHVQQTTAYAAAVDYCMKTTFNRTGMVAVVEIESCEHPEVPERIGYQREALFPTTVVFTQKEEKVRV